VAALANKGWRYHRFDVRQPVAPLSIEIQNPLITFYFHWKLILKFDLAEILHAFFVEISPIFLNLADFTRSRKRSGPLMVLRG